jgi:hypothetical protein
METRKQLKPRFSIPSSLSRINWHAWLPTRGNVLFTLIAVLALFLVQTAGAFSQEATDASTTSWPYQGRLADTAGNPLTGVYPMIFRLYSASSGGIFLWEEQWTGPNSVQVSDGLFNVMLGNLTPIPQSVVTGNSSLWLGITVGADDEMTPRVQLGSVPYAAQALTVPDGAIDTTKLADGSVTQVKLGSDVSLIPPDGSITTEKLANNAVTSAKIADGTVGTADLANGSVTAAKLGSNVANIFVQGGRLEATEYTPGYGLHTGSGERYYVAWVPFSQSFSSTPVVVASLSKFNLLGSRNTCLDVYPQNISSGGFELVYHTWWDCTVYLVAASWIAYGSK